MYRMCMTLFTLSVIDLIGSTSAGNVRSRSPSRRLIFDANQQFTGWASWEQYAACSTRCVSGYENETKQCCETGDNRLCYNLPWNILKMFIGTCPNATTTLESTTTSTTAATTTSTAVTTTSTSTTRSTSAAPTIQLPKTLPPITTTCAVCAGPPFLCEKLYTPTPCQPPNNYCINTVTNHKDGTKTVDRSCGNFDTCYREWFQASSDIDLCRRFDENDEQRLDFQCTFCCVTDNCNIPLYPSDSSLYRPST